MFGMVDMLAHAFLEVCKDRPDFSWTVRVFRQLRGDRLAENPSVQNSRTDRLVQIHD